ncbi:MAG: alternative ribosome rescue aminoacyl-tRNA hydrolase ArfB [Planctomycetota bacterium]|nr:alternative ribosome rescue aminoacyl-tRNA hydrolase ArfB [Planctomycetota bacterium]
MSVPENVPLSKTGNPHKAASVSVSARIQIPLSELEFTFVRSSGPGGQNVNKVNSKAVMRWPIASSPSIPRDVRGRFLERYGSRVSTEGDLILTSQRYRDQRRNEEDCLEKLRELLLTVARPPVRRKKTKPSRASVERGKVKKKEHSQKKEGRRWRDG